MDISYHIAYFQVAAEWNFFATSHGKSPCDSVCGTIAAHASLWGTQITNPRELYEWAKSNITGVNFSFTSKVEHENEASL